MKGRDTRHKDMMDRENMGIRQGYRRPRDEGERHKGLVHEGLRDRDTRDRGMMYLYIEVRDT